ncbi:tRNA1(Val) (adenine(37)-N6)-methyltransferase [Alkaliphilus peptidifermentans]|uniref:tRNA1Val (Adenine37-N6)-methyltransferase n=1 Tax=Alkaliphilus peptidifermentans DSM 18978 TaxID=1120976 RepID=A0A1G5ANX9_9FIRM|nr:tRNA1(Val) (adenine(37)-N6)-methyltransferase [Alkaliphilus peptidifermentans]SCX79579.1 tRNA1Val (adenine37-N6)-methyltransferase [Alkaliphilus peptidifermentans DSM 18978]
MENLLKDYERIDDLHIKDLKIIQNTRGFCFGIDAVLLASFVELKKNSKVMDLGTGTGIIPLLLAGKSTSSSITAIEIQQEVADMAIRSVVFNKLEDRIKILNIDLKTASEHVPVNEFDVVTTNPPYMHANGLINPDDKKAISRHEIKCSLEDVIQTASKLLKHHGRFFMIHRPQRLVDIMVLCRKHKLEPKRLQFIHPAHGRKPNLLMIDCRKAAQPELRILDPLVVYDEDGEYTQELLERYNKKTVEERGDANE